MYFTIRIDAAGAVLALPQLIPGHVPTMQAHAPLKTQPQTPNAPPTSFCPCSSCD